MNLTGDQLEKFLDECEQVYKEDEQFLLDHGWVRDNAVWVSPKGKRCRHHLGFFNDDFDLENGLAIDVCKQEIVLDQFNQFEVQFFNDDDEPKNFKGSEEPYDWLFPCIKDGKIYHYIEAVNIAVYGIDKEYDLDRWIALKKLLETLDVNNIKSKQVIEVIEFYDFDTKEYRFELRNKCTQKS